MASSDGRNLLLGYRSVVVLKNMGVSLACRSCWTAGSKVVKTRADHETTAPFSPFSRPFTAEKKGHKSPKILKQSKPAAFCFSKKSSERGWKAYRLVSAVSTRSTPCFWQVPDRAFGDPWEDALRGINKKRAEKQSPFFKKINVSWIWVISRYFKKLNSWYKLNLLGWENASGSNPKGITQVVF